MLTGKSSSSKKDNFTFSGKPAGLTISSSIFEKELICALCHLDKLKNVKSVAFRSDHSLQDNAQVYKFSSTNPQDKSAPSDSKTCHNQGY